VGRRPRLVAVVLAIGILAGCTAERPSTSATRGLPILGAEVAVATAERLAEIGRPFLVGEVTGGRYADLDPTSHNNPGDLVEAERLRRIADRASWRIMLNGPDGSETLVVDAETGEVLAATIQGS